MLFAHGSSEPQWAQPFERLAGAVRQKVKAGVALAYLERMSPSLGEALATLAQDGALDIRVVPVFLGQGAHARQDLPKLVAAARERHPDLRISLEPPIGEQAAVIEAIASAIAPDPTR